MTRIYLVRHGKAAAAWGDDVDPGLDEAGRLQAAQAAAGMASRGPLPIVVSPLRRTRETASAFEQVWDSPSRIDPRVAEIPSPTADLASRPVWLRGVMQGHWPRLDAVLQTWRQDVLRALSELDTDTLVVSHFVAINVAVGHALEDDRVVCFEPDNCSCTVLENSGRRLRVVELGIERTTRIV